MENTMEVYLEFLEENNLKQKYIEWLENKINPKQVIVSSTAKTPHDYKTKIEYNDSTLWYETMVYFPRFLSSSEMETVNNIINYWSALPFVSTEGNNGVKWGINKNSHCVTIDIDFTKSASDDYTSHEILEKLGEWIWHGTPLRKKTKDRKYEGVLQPTRVSAGT